MANDRILLIAQTVPASVNVVLPTAASRFGVPITIKDYGGNAGALPKNNIAAPTNREKQEGPEESVGFGADSSAPRARSDRGSRKARTTAANPVASYKRGGAVPAGRLVSFWAGGSVKKRASGGKVESPEGVAPATKMPGGGGGAKARLFKEKRAERDYAKA